METSSAPPSTGRAPYCVEQCPHCLDTVLATLQVQHSRRGGVVSKLETGRFSGGRAVKLSAVGQLAGGSAAAADLGPDRLDNQILLDYGALDEDNLQVQCFLDGRRIYSSRRS